MNVRSIRQLTVAPYGHLLTNSGVWSCDSRWIVYDIRSDAAGSCFDGDRIERVDVETGRVEVLFESRHGACCGVVTSHPQQDRVVFIHGPEHPTEAWNYGASRRCGVILDLQTGESEVLDARNMIEPFTRGSLRGGTHVHTWSPNGDRIAFTYEDQYLIEQAAQTDHSLHHRLQSNQRLIGVAAPLGTVVVPKSHPRNHDGSHHCATVITANDSPEAGTEQLLRACSDAWVGTRGYRNRAGDRIEYAIAFQGRVRSKAGDWIDEVFVVDLPQEIRADDFPDLSTSASTRLPPLKRTDQRRLTWTDDEPYPGLQGARHWLRSNPGGTEIYFLRRDSTGVVQIGGVDPATLRTRWVTNNATDIESAFTVSPCGNWIAHRWQGELAVTSVEQGGTKLLTERRTDQVAIRPEACVWSPDGKRIAFVRPVASGSQVWNQIFVADCE